MAETKQKNEKHTPLPVVIITPFLIFAICAAITVVLGITPYNKFQTYIHVSFSDSMKNTTSAADSITVS